MPENQSPWTAYNTGTSAYFADCHARAGTSPLTSDSLPVIPSAPTGARLWRGGGPAGRAVNAVIMSGGGSACRLTVARALREVRLFDGKDKAREVLKHLYYVSGGLGLKDGGASPPSVAGCPGCGGKI